MSKVNLTIHGYDATRWIVAREQRLKMEWAADLLGIDADIFLTAKLTDKKGIRPPLEAVAVQLDCGELLACLLFDGGKMIRVPRFRFGEVFGDLLEERDPDVRFEFGKLGFRYGFRNEFACGTLEIYEPMNEVERARRSDRRRELKAARQIEAEKKLNPLFAHLVGLP